MKGQSGPRTWRSTPTHRPPSLHPIEAYTPAVGIRVLSRGERCARDNRRKRQWAFFPPLVATCVTITRPTSFRSSSLSWPSRRGLVRRDLHVFTQDRRAEAGLLQPIPPLGNVRRATPRHGPRAPHRVAPVSSFISSLPQDLSGASPEFRSDPLRCGVLDPEASELSERSDDRSREVRRPVLGLPDQG